MGKLEASHTVEIEAPIEAVYEIAADIDTAEEWMPSVKSADVIERFPDGKGKLVELEVDAVVKTTKAILAYEYESPESITWEQEKGDAKWLKGKWELSAIDEGNTRATYALATDPGRMLGMLLRGPVEGKVKEFLTKGAAEGLKERAEAQ